EGDMKRAPSGRRTALASPPATGWKLSPVSQLTRLLAGPLFLGLIRYPASRSIGSASSAIGGRLARSYSAQVARSGLRLGVGVGLRSRTSAIGAGGCWEVSASWASTGPPKAAISTKAGRARARRRRRMFETPQQPPTGPAGPPR